MKKIIIGVLITLLILIGAAWVSKDYIIKQNGLIAGKASERNRFPIEKIGKSEPNMNNFIINSIFKHAENGKMPDVSIVVGETDIDEVITNWGEPDHSITAGDNIYIDYKAENVTFGYQNHIIFEVRSFADELSNIHLNDIINVIGEADEQRYYQDSEVDQIILVYNVNESNQLKWVLPRPTDTNPNPQVHHVNVFTEPANIVNDEPSMVDSMTLDEKIGQMMMVGVDGTTTTPETTKLIKDFKVGGIILFRDNLTSYVQSLHLINGIKKLNSENKIPMFLSVDQEGGRVKRLPGLDDLPTNYEIGLRNDPAFSYNIGEVLAQELQAFGMNVNYAPVMDVNSNPNNPVIGDRSFGDNAQLVSKLGIQTMNGMKDNNIISVIKHFPGHGDTSVDSHFELPRIDKSIQELDDTELIPFREAIEAGADMVMVAHILFPQLDSDYPSSMSKPIITDLLREKLGFNGVVITDDMMMDAIANHYDIGEAAVQSIQAGTDIILISEHYEDIVHTFEAIHEAVQSGEISEERINESVKRIIALKEKYNLNDEEVEFQELQNINEKIRNLSW